MTKKYLVVGWNSAFVDPGFQSEHESLDSALAEADSITAKPDQGYCDVYEVVKIKSYNRPRYKAELEIK